jgi:hypothetical protein
MAQQEDSRVSIEKTKTRVILKVNSVELTMTAALARELGDKLYKCGCDVAQTEGRA